MRYLRRISCVLSFLVLCGCTTATLPDDEQQAKRSELDEMADNAVASLVDEQPEAREFLEQCKGYAVIDMRSTKIPVVGTGVGYGVVQDGRSGNRTYTRVSRFEIGGGLGTQKYKVIIFFSDDKLLDRAIKGTWHFDAGAEAAAGDSALEGSTNKSDSRYRAFKISESGAVATVTVRVARSTPYLNE